MSSIAPLAYNPLPLGTVVPSPGSWMHAQLTAQKAGLCGRQWLGQLGWNSFPGHVANSSWVGGDGFGALEEAYPYWLNGALPMSVLLMGCDDGKGSADAEVLLQGIESGLDYIFGKAAENGWLGPTVPNECPSPWASFRFCTAITMYIDAFGKVETCDDDDQRCMRADRAILAMFQHASALLMYLKANPLRSGSWEHSRWVEILESYAYLMSTPYWTKADQGQRDDVFHLLQIAQEQGFDWPTWLESSQEKPFANNTSIRGWFPNNTLDADDIGENKWQDQGIDRQWTHGVNLGQALSVYPLLSRLESANVTWLERGRLTMDRIMALHGQASGVFTADENLAGLEPNRGTETCAVVELMNALSNSFSASGDVKYLDQLERVAYNALPAAFFNGTMASLIYYQQVNKLDATNYPPDCENDASNCQYCYGLLFECCVANHVQGWPKFVMRQIQLSADGRLAITQYFGSTIMRTIHLPGGTTVGSLRVETDYPFSDIVTLKLDDVSAPFKLEMRIPEWCKEAQIHINGVVTREDISPGTMHPIQIGTGSATVELFLPMKIRVERRNSFYPSLGVETVTNSANIFRGPLLYALSRDHKWDVGKYFDEAVANNYLLGTGKWQHALIVDDDLNPSERMHYERKADLPLPDGQGPFATALVSDRIIAQAILLSADEWDVKRKGRGSIRECNEGSTSVPYYNSSWTGTMPRSPVPCAERLPIHVTIELVPYGATDIRIAEFVSATCDHFTLK